MRPIPATRLGDAHGLLRAIEKRGRLRTDEFVTEFNLDELFPPGLENALGRLRHFISFGRLAGLVKEDRGVVELTEIGKRYVRSEDPDAVFDVSSQQAEWLRRQLRERHMTDSIFHGLAIGLSLLASVPPGTRISTMDFGRSMAYLGRAGWDNENTLLIQGERHLTLLTDLELIDADHRLTADRRAAPGRAHAARAHVARRHRRAAEPRRRRGGPSRPPRRSSPRPAPEPTPEVVEHGADPRARRGGGADRRRRLPDRDLLGRRRRRGPPEPPADRPARDRRDADPAVPRARASRRRPAPAVRRSARASCRALTPGDPLAAPSTPPPPRRTTARRVARRGRGGGRRARRRGARRRRGRRPHAARRRPLSSAPPPVASAGPRRAAGAARVGAPPPGPPRRPARRGR